MDKDIRQLLDAVIMNAPKTAEEGFLKLVHEMIAAGESGVAIVIALAGGLHDGWTKGNWPT